jgi:hypothetical protein
VICPGYGRVCIVVLPDDRDLCHYCQRTKELASSDTPACVCGGIAGAAYHLDSLLHRTWAQRERERRGTTHGGAPGTAPISEWQARMRATRKDR